MSEPIKVGVIGDIEEEEALILGRDVTGWSDNIAVFFSNDQYRALNDTCTHEEASLGEGWIEGDEVECPIHSATFSLCTGAALCLPATLGARTHRVELRGDEIWLHVGVPADALLVAADD